MYTPYLKWVQNGDYGLGLGESGALALISISRPILDQEYQKQNINKSQKLLARVCVCGGIFPIYPYKTSDQPPKAVYLLKSFRVC